MSLRITVARSIGELESLASRWQWLQRHSPDATLFQSFAWNLLAARTFAHQPPHVVHIESENAQLIFPAAIHEGWCLTLLGEAMSDYVDFLSAGSPDDVEEALAAAWQALAELRLPLGMQSVRSHFRYWSALQPCEFVHAPCARPCDISADQFALLHPKLSDRFRRLQRRGAKLITLDPAREPDLLRDIYFAKARQFALSGNNLFADRRRIEFMVQACAQPAIAAELFGLEIEGSLAAALLTFREPEVRRIYTVWYDPQWARYSPGMLLLYEITRRSLAEDRIADFLTGDQPHKSRLATFSVPLYRIEADADALLALAARTRELQVAA